MRVEPILEALLGLGAQLSLTCFDQRSNCKDSVMACYEAAMMNIFIMNLKWHDTMCSFLSVQKCLFLMGRPGCSHGCLRLRINILRL